MEPTFTRSCRLYEHPPVHTIQAYRRNILNNVFGLQMSQGTVSNILQRMRKKAEKDYGCHIRSEIEKAEVVGADETGVKINGETALGVWTFQTDALTYMAV